jgi:hypothetical protein
MKTKLVYSELDNLFNTGDFKWMLLEIVMMFIMPYPSLYNATYMEKANDKDADAVFQWNDFLLCFCIFVRIHFLARAILNMSNYTEARA